MAILAGEHLVEQYHVKLLCTLLCLSTVLFLAKPAHAADVRLAGVLPGGGVIHKQITSMREARYAGIVKQETDYSCGAAALATILKYAYGREIREAEVLRGMMRVSDPKTVRDKGFSLLDMKNYLSTLGIRGRGYLVSARQLNKVKVPTIVLVDIEGYKHFVVLKKATNRKVYFADPALGNKSMSVDKFAVAWNGVVFAVIGKGYDQNTILRRSTGSASVKRHTLGPPIWDAELFEFGFAHAHLF